MFIKVGAIGKTVKEYYLSDHSIVSNAISIYGKDNDLSKYNVIYIDHTRYELSSIDKSMMINDKAFIVFACENNNKFLGSIPLKKITTKVVKHPYKIDSFHWIKYSQDSAKWEIAKYIGDNTWYLFDDYSCPQEEIYQIDRNEIVK